jgi:uncharacterized protein (TIGR00369 family)
VNDNTALPAGIDHLTRLRENMARPPLHQAFLHPDVMAVDEATGVVTIRLPYRPEFRRFPEEGGYHGGIIAAFIDLAGHAAIYVQHMRIAPTIDLRVDYIRPAPGGDLFARSKMLRLGRSVARADVEVADSDGNLIAVGRGAYSTVWEK